MAREPAEKRAYVRYSARLAERIIDEVSTGRSLLEVCAMPGMPDRHSVRRWCIERPAFAARFEEARKWSGYALLDEIDDLVDRGQEIVEAAAKNGGSAQAAASVLREQLNVKRWKVGKLLPQYGERSQVELTGAGGKDLMPATEMEKTHLALTILTLLRGNSPSAPEPPSGIRFIDPPASDFLAGAKIPAEPAEPPPTPALRPKFDPNGFLIEQSPPAPAPTPAELFALDREAERFRRVIGGEEADAIQPRVRRRYSRLSRMH